MTDWDAILHLGGMSYARSKEIFEKGNAKCQTYPPTFYHGFSRISSPHTRKSFHETYRHLGYVDEKNTSFSFIRRWLDDKQARTFRRAEFVAPPSICPDDTLNLWTGFRIEREPHVGGSIAAFVAQIGVIVANEPTHVLYLTKFLAQIIQFPCIPIRIGLVCLGSEENELFFQRFAAILNSERFEWFSHPRLLLMNYKGYAAKRKRSLLYVGALHRRDAGRLRLMIMGSSMLRVVVTNSESIGLSGDHLAVVHAAEKSRYYSVSDEFKIAFENLDNRRAVFQYLKTFDLTGTDWIRDRPV